jgi:hypothetical protein
MKHFEKWAKDKSFLLKIASLVIVGIEEEILGFMQGVKAEKRIEGYIPLPDADEWLNLYRKHRKIHEGVADALRQVDDVAAKTVDFYEQLLSGFHHLRQFKNQEVKKMMEELKPNEKKKISDYLQNKFQELQNYITENIVLEDETLKEEYDEEEKKRIRLLFHNPEMLFFIRVWAPCLFLYGDYPIRLLRKARQGDEDALDKLLRLDRTVIYDSRVKIHLG